MKKVVAIIPARSGSKRLAKKNILRFNNKPLIIWTIEAALKSRMIDKIIVSSNCKIIKKISYRYKRVNFSKRPERLSTSKSKISDTILHEIKKNDLEEFDYLILLQPTSPLRNLKDIDNFIKLIIKKKTNTCVSFYKQDINLDNLYKIKLNKVEKLFKFQKKSKINKLYSPSGDIYISTIKNFLKNKTFFTNQTHPYFVKDYSDIDTLKEFKMAETMQKNFLKK